MSGLYQAKNNNDCKKIGAKPRNITGEYFSTKVHFVSADGNLIF
ncbi:hypothetical protein BMETH_2964_0 [methanotrophic bacterial endosymbiont of Bathymodiolus sp.]|nr:hypothetical protein BMETH_2964_0 [methanotrophic bacterial endosymbiont of Bathymodiolus sp.]